MSHDPLELGRSYVENNSIADSVNVRLRPEHWRTHDFSKAL